MSAWAAAWLTVLGAALLAPSPARADCAINGSTITCSDTGGTQTTPVGTGAEDGMTVNVQSGAVIDLSGSAGATAIDLHDNNTVVNSGTVIASDNALGISVNNGNSVTNNGTVTVGDGGTGINACCDNVIVNSGTINAGDTGGFGIFVTDNSRVTNSGTINVGAASYGIMAVGDGAPSGAIVNTGTINALGGFGIGAFTNYTVTNSGTINAGVDGTGIQVDGGNTVVNNGTINFSGTLGTGVSLNASGDTTVNTVTNNGSILGTGQTTAILGDSNNVVINNGLVQGAILLTGLNNTLTNRGTLMAADLSLTTFVGNFIGGTLINDPSGTIAIRVSPTANDFYLADNVALNGGRLHIVVTPALYGTTTVYSNATTGSAPISACGCGALTGAFGTVTTSSPFFMATADYSSTIDVNVTLTRFGFGSVPGSTSTQRSVGNVLESGYSPSLDPTSTLGQFYVNLLTTSSLGILDQLSGSGTAAAQSATFSSGALFGGTMTQQGLSWLSGSSGGFGTTFGGLPYASPAANRLANRPGADAFAAMQPQPGRWRVWGSGFGATRSIDGQNGSSADQRINAGGGIFGVDREIARDLLLGFAVGASGSTYSVSGLSTSGRSDAGHVGAYALKTFGAGYLAATLYYAHAANKTDRTIAGIGTTEYAKGSFNSDQLGGRLEFGWRHALKSYTLTPFVAVEPAVLWQQGYSEASTTSTGAPGILGLTYQSNRVTSFPAFLGVQLDGRYALDGGHTLSPFARLSWVHEFETARNIQASFITLPGGSFIAEGARASENALRLEAGATLSLSGKASLFASVNGEWSNTTSSVAGLGGLRLGW